MIKKNNHIKDFILPMERFPVAPPDSSLRLAIEQMNKKKIGAVCIVDENHQLIGMLTDGDIRRIIIKKQKPFSEILGEDVINYANKKPVIVLEHTSLKEAVNIMEERQIWDLPVITEKKILIGLLHLHPIVKYLIEPQV